MEDSQATEIIDVPAHLPKVSASERGTAHLLGAAVGNDGPGGAHRRRREAAVAVSFELAQLLIAVLPTYAIEALRAILPAHPRKVLVAALAPHAPCPRRIE